MNKCNISILFHDIIIIINNMCEVLTNPKVKKILDDLVGGCAN